MSAASMERSDAKVREQEGMERYMGFIGEPFDTKVEILENGVRYYVDVKDGQKTGFFLDQKYNRRAVAKLCKRCEGTGLFLPIPDPLPSMQALQGRSM